MYAHIVLLSVVLMSYRFVPTNYAQYVESYVEDTASMVLINEPEMIPQASSSEDIHDENQESQILIDENWDDNQYAQEQVLPEQFSEEIVTQGGSEEVVTESNDQQLLGDEYSSDNSTILPSWDDILGLSGEVLYDMSGNQVGEIHIASWEIFPVDMSGEVLMPQPLSVIYPSVSPVLDASGYIRKDTLFSVITTWGIPGETYCSRIAWENISAILKAGIRTRRETNQFILQGDAEQLIKQGLQDQTLLEVTSEKMKHIFSWDNGLAYGYIYDVYISFLQEWEPVYHRIAIVYADDSKETSESERKQRWVLDPLRGAKTVEPQLFTDYIAYYQDKIDLKRYIGQAYIPSVIKTAFSRQTDIIEALSGMFTQEHQTWWGQVPTVEQQEQEQQLLQEGTGQQEQVLEIWTGEHIGTWGEENQRVDTDTDTEDIWSGLVASWQLSRAYTKEEYDDDIIILQKLLHRLGRYTGAYDGRYSQDVIDALYQYQLANVILTPQDPVALRWYLWPTTRKSLQQAYKKFYLTSLKRAFISTQICTSQEENQCRDTLEDRLTKKWYFRTKKGLVPLSKLARKGKQPLDIQELRGRIDMPIIMQSETVYSWQQAEVQIPEHTLFFTQQDEIFTGEITTPTFLEPHEYSWMIDQTIISAVEVWAEEPIYFTDEEGNPRYATLRIPAPGMHQGDTVDVWYAYPGEQPTYLTTVDVQLIDEEPYAIFETNHFTQFYLGTELGSFTINNDDAYTTGLSVTLTSNVLWATHMRFGNSIAERDAASRVAYSPNYPRTLTGAGGDGIKRVYAQFSGNGVIRNVSDSIIYNTSSGSMSNGLLTHLDWSYTGTTFYDISPFGYHFTASAVGMNGLWWWIEQIMLFNGSRQITRNTTPAITSYPFTISAWVRPDRVNIVQGIVAIGRSTTNNIYYGLMMNSTTFQAVARNTTSRTANGTIAAQAGKWYHVVGVFSSPTSRTIYVNGVQWATNTVSVTLNTISQQRTVGKLPGTATNRFSGAIDEVRIYNRALSATEIQNLYMIPPTFDAQTAFTGTPILYGTLPPKITQIDVVISGVTLTTTTIGAGTGKRRTWPYATPFANGIYDVTLRYTNVYGITWQITYPNALTINTSGIIVTYTPNTRTSGDVIATLTGLDPTYMIVNNFWSQWYTFTGNGSFVYQYVDKQGTTGTTQAQVTWIDKIIPTFTGVVAGAVYTGSLSGNLYLGQVSIDFTDENFSGATINGQPYTSWTVITWAGDYVFEVSDFAGNTTWARFTIYFTPDQHMHNQLITKGYTITGIALVPLDDMYYVGNTGIDMGITIGKLIHPVVIQSWNTRSGYRAEIQIESWLFVMTKDNGSYTGFLSAPVFQNPSTYQHMFTTPIISAVHIGSPTTHIMFQDTDEHIQEVVIRIPVPWRSGGELINIYTSEDGSSFIHEYTVPVQYIDGQPYVIFTSKHCSVFVTTPSNGTNISADQASNASWWGAYTVLWSIVLTEGVNTDFGVSQNNVTLILTPPANRRFRPGYGTVTYTANRDITAASISVTATGATITYSTNGSPNRIDSLTISNLQVQAISGNILPSSGNILRTCANPGTAPMVGIVCDVTNFWTLSQTFWTGKYMVITLSGETFVPSVGNIWTPENQRVDTPFMLAWLTATDQFFNIIKTYTGSRTIAYTGMIGTYTTGVVFSGWQSMTALRTVAHEAKTWISLIASDGVLSWPASTMFDVKDREAILYYSTTWWQESQVLNDWSISGYISINLSSWSLNPNIVESGYVQIYNIPSGLSPYMIRSWSYQLLIYLTGSADNHFAQHSVDNIYIQFLSWAFQEYHPEDVKNSTFSWLSITFYDPIGYLPGQQLRLKGWMSGTQYIDSSPNNRLTTGYNGIGNSLWSTETVLGPFNGTNQYIDIGSYALTAYTISAWFNSAQLWARRSIIGDPGTSFEISQNPDNQIEVYGVITSTSTIQANRRYHVAFVMWPTQTQLYIDGVLNNQNTTYKAINSPLTVGLAYGNQYRSGLIDEVQIYDRPLSSGEIAELYMKRPSYTPQTVYTSIPILTGMMPDPYMHIRVTISGTTYTGTNNQDGTWTVSAIWPLSSGTYDVQLTYMNVYGKTGSTLYTSGLIVDGAFIGSLSISWPVYFDFQERDVSDQMQTREVVCTGLQDYFKVIDELGADSGYYTTLQISDMLNASGDTIPASQIAVKMVGDIQTLAWLPNPRVMSAITGTYQYFSTPLIFKYRNPGINNGILGQYGIHTARKIDIPALQNPGEYTGVIIYTLYDW